MHYRTLGRTGLSISEVGYGSWGIGKTGWIGADDKESLQALQTAIDLGLNFIDTALGYGNGHSEQLVGQVVRKNSDKQIYVATKVPPQNGQWPARAGISVQDTFPKEHIIKCTEASLRNLGADTIDILQFHVWLDEWVGQGDWLETIQQLKEQGKIRFFGISINDHETENGIKLIETGMVDTVQVIYNIFDQSPEDRLLSICQSHNIGVIVRAPLDEGGLTGKITPDTSFDPHDFRSHYFEGTRKHDVYERVNHMAADLGVSIDDIPEIALLYILSNPAVSTIIPGMRTIRNVERNTAVGDGQGLSPDKLKILKRYRWIRNFYA